MSLYGEKSAYWACSMPCIQWWHFLLLEVALCIYVFACCEAWVAFLDATCFLTLPLQLFYFKSFLGDDFHELMIKTQILFLLCLSMCFAYVVFSLVFGCHFWVAVCSHLVLCVYNGLSLPWACRVSGEPRIVWNVNSMWNMVQIGGTIADGEIWCIIRWLRSLDMLASCQ